MHGDQTCQVCGFSCGLPVKYYAASISLTFLNFGKRIGIQCMIRILHGGSGVRVQIRPAHIEREPGRRRMQAQEAAAAPERAAASAPVRARAIASITHVQ